MERTPSETPSTPPRDVLAGTLSALVPGLGQLMRGRIADAALYLLATLWIHGFFAGLATADEHADPVTAVLVLAFGLPQGFARPVAVVFTVFGLALHAFSAWDAARPPALAEGDTSQGGEADPASESSQKAC